MKLLKRFFRFIAFCFLFVVLISPFLLGFFLKLLATGFYAGIEQAEKFVNKY